MKFKHISMKIELKFANAPFTNVITTLMICRLMLNLRQAGTPEQNPSSVSNGSYRFSIQTRPAYLGDLGEDLDIDSFDRKDRKRAHHHSDMGYLVGREPDFEMSSYSIRWKKSRLWMLSCFCFLYFHRCVQFFDFFWTRFFSIIAVMHIK